MSYYGGAGWGLGPNTKAIREWRTRVESRAMTTRFDDALNALENSQNFKEKSDARIYLRDLYASHKALLKAATELYAHVKKAPFNVLKDAREAIRNAEELK